MGERPPPSGRCVSHTDAPPDDQLPTTAHESGCGTVSPRAPRDHGVRTAGAADGSVRTLRPPTRR